MSRTGSGLTRPLPKDLGLVETKDHPRIFEAARAANTTVLTKDRDFVDLVKRRGAPPQIIWITCGNTSTPEMKRVLEATFENASALLASEEIVVEVKG